LGVGAVRACAVLLPRQGKDPAGLLLTTEEPIQLCLDGAGRASLPAAPVLLDDRLAQLDALPADVDLAGALDQGTHVPIVLATKGAKGIAMRHDPSPPGRTSDP